MSENKGIIYYIETMQKAKKVEDIDLYTEADELSSTVATYEDIEEAVAYTMRVLGAYIMTQETVEKVRYDSLLGTLLGNGSLSQEEYDMLQEQDDELIRQLYEEDE